jgi:sugar/nucleoside kinase (ribokinase family)
MIENALHKGFAGMNDRAERLGPITVFGAANIDHIGWTKSAAVMGASNPGRMRTTPGGVGFNVATILARLGHAVRLVARIGGDTGGDTIRTAADAAGIDTRHLSVSKAPTATYLAALDDKGGLIIGIAGMEIHDEMAPGRLVKAIETAPDGDWWVADANLPAETLAFLTRLARQAGRPIAALGVSPAKAVRLAPLLSDLDLLFVNRKEATVLLGLADDAPPRPAKALAEKLAGRPRPNVVVTDAAAPLAAAAGGTVRSFAPLRAAIRSVNGAGDALAAGVIHGLASGATLFEAIRPGLAAAALTMEYEGTVPPTLTAAALAARLGAATETESP